MAAKPKTRKKKDEIPEYAPDPTAATATISDTYGDPPEDSSMVNVGKLGTININDLSPDQRNMAYTAGAKQGLTPEYFQKAYGTPTGADGQPLAEKDLYLPAASFGSAMVDPRTGDYFTGNNQWVAQQSAKLQAQGLPSLIPAAQYEQDKKLYEDKYVDAQFDEEGMLDPERAKTFADFRGRMMRKMALDKQAAEPAAKEPAEEPAADDVVVDPTTGNIYTEKGGGEGIQLTPDLEDALARDLAAKERVADIPDTSYAEQAGYATEPVPAEPVPEPDDEGFDDDDGDEAETPVPFFGREMMEESAKTVFTMLTGGPPKEGVDEEALAKLIEHLSDDRFANMTPDEAIEALREERYAVIGLPPL